MKLTKIALALVAVLAMSALTASAASALTYNSSNPKTNLSGSQNGKHAFKVDGQAVECTTANFTKNEQPTGTTKIEGVVASYSGCTAFGFAGAEVNMGTCKYNFLNPNLTPAIMAEVSIACTNNSNVNTNPNNGNIRIFSTVFGSECEVHVASQTRNTLSFTNNTPVAGDVRVTAEVTGITAEKTKDNGVCPLTGTGVTNNATYNGATDVNAEGATTIAVS